MRVRFLMAGLFLAGGGLLAQGPPPGRGRFGPPGGPGARFLGGEPGMPGRIVKNAPFTGDLVTETSQTLSDGNHIKHSTTAHLVRDSEGRTRREQSLSGLGALGSTARNVEAVFISDPVAGINYALNPVNRTYTKLAEGGRGRGGHNAQSANGPRWERSVKRDDVKTEPLGKQTIEGLSADGTRTTQTIPAGAMGNELPIQVVTERWYSADLQMDVMTRRTDPRFGEIVTKLTNVSRAEPNHMLFEPPSDYSAEERRAGQQ